MGTPTTQRQLACAKPLGSTPYLVVDCNVPPLTEPIHAPAQFPVSHEVVRCLFQLTSVPHLAKKHIADLVPIPTTAIYSSLLLFQAPSFHNKANQRVANYSVVIVIPVPLTLAHAN